ncbi:GntR family transcriptional regulator [Streptomyces sp. NPDC057474]|uniref:GntR family transcriptional regulator n=1 Tax=Streptomyces sp. NPDC057474 TaxID=3346144 RepID=UPI0036C6BAEA
MVTSDSATSGGRAFQRVEEALRHLLATRRPGDVLPPQRELAVTFDVSRYTLQRVLGKFTDEGWIKSVQGSGMTVLRVPNAPQVSPQPGRVGSVMLGPLISKAFEQPEVSLDVYSLTSETLVGHVRVQAERIMAGEIAPERVTVRMLLPQEDHPLAYPRAKDPGDHRIWERWRAMTRQRQAEMRSLRQQLSGRVEVDLQIRKTPLTPDFKLYVLNGSEMLYGPYKVIEWDILLDDGTMVPSVDVLGLGSPLSYHPWDEDEDSHDGSFFMSMTDWFESRWTLLSENSATS